MSKLYLVPSPIGNLGDITLRALEVIKEVDVVYAEDTRKTGILLNKYNISKPVKPHHKFNEHKTVQGIVLQIKLGQKIALVTDAGTPGISDPGFLLVRECIKEDVPVECLPGPTALIPALVNSGLPSERFVFEGFLPQKKGRQTRLINLANEERTIILYESPHRLVKSLQQFIEYFGSDRNASVSRELSKIYEETIRGTLLEVYKYYENRAIKGEIVIVIEGTG